MEILNISVVITYNKMTINKLLVILTNNTL